MSESKDDDQLHPEMREVAGKEASMSPDGGNSSNSEDASSPAPPTALVETYVNQIEQNQAANRLMRWWAFGVVGALTAIYLIALLYILFNLFDAKLIAGAVGASDGPLDWHVLVLVGIALAIFAAIPLSLAMAMVKMISEKREDDDAALKTPTTELGKVILDLLKSVISASKGN